MDAPPSFRIIITGRVSFCPPHDHSKLVAHADAFADTMRNAGYAVDTIDCTQPIPAHQHHPKTTRKLPNKPRRPHLKK